MTEATVSFAGNLTDDPEVRHTEGGIARAMFRVAVSGRREQESSFFTVIVWRDQAEHAAESLSKGSRVVVAGRPAGELDGRGGQRPIHRRGAGRGVGAEPAVGDGDHDQVDAQHGQLVGLCQVGARVGPVRRSQRGAGRWQRGQTPAQQASRTCSSRNTWYEVRPARPVLGPAAAG